jgi:threonine 3-dehydrogenase
MVVAGTPRQPIVIEDGTRDVLKKEATIMGIHGREMFQTWETMNRLATDLGVDPGIIVTHRFALQDFDQAFDLALRAEGGKILLLP